MKEIVNKQFEMLGVVTRVDDLDIDGMMKVGKKKEYYYHVFHFTEQQEALWRAWALNKIGPNSYELKRFQYIDLRYGLLRDYKKKGAE